MRHVTIPTQAGIYESETTIKDYGDRILVSLPFVRWKDNTGALDFHKMSFDAESEHQKCRQLREMMNAETLVLQDGTTISEVIAY